MSMFGGDLAQMDHLASQFTAQAASVSQLRSRIDGTLSSTAWTGPAAERFRSDWSGQFVPALNRLEQALTEAAGHVRNRREAIAAATG